MKMRIFGRSFAAALIGFGSLAVLLIGIITAYIGTRKVGFDSHTTILEIYDINTIRFMDWYFETKFFETTIKFIIKHLPVV